MSKTECIILCMLFAAIALVSLIAAIIDWRAWVTFAVAIIGIPVMVWLRRHPVN